MFVFYSTRDKIDTFLQRYGVDFYQHLKIYLTILKVRLIPEKLFVFAVNHSIARDYERTLITKNR